MSGCVKAVLVDSLTEADVPGAFKYFSRGDVERAGLNFKCPCGCDAVYGATFGSNGHAWSWDGNVTEPTVIPSLGCHRSDGGQGYHWHGFLTNGEFREC